MNFLSSLPIRIMAEVPSAMSTAMDGVGDSMKASLEGMATQMVDIVAMIAPIGLSIFGCVFLWKKGKQFFEKLT